MLKEVIQCFSKFHTPYGMYMSHTHRAISHVRRQSPWHQDLSFPCHEQDQYLPKKG